MPISVTLRPRSISKVYNNRQHLELNSSERNKHMIPKKLITIAILAVLLIAACNKKQTTTTSNKVRIGYIGLTCEASIFMAVEKGFFKEEGLDVEMVKCDWKNYKDTLALGGYDMTKHLVMYFLKPIEQGLDVKFTGGIHRGCLRVQAAAKRMSRFGLDR